MKDEELIENIENLISDLTKLKDNYEKNMGEKQDEFYNLIDQMKEEKNALDDTFIRVDELSKKIKKQSDDFEKLQNSTIDISKQIYYLENLKRQIDLFKARMDEFESVIKKAQQVFNNIEQLEKRAKGIDERFTFFEHYKPSYIN